jgi:hypothetical protein
MEKTLLFVSDAIYNGTVKYRRGEIINIGKDEAYRWIRRGIAIPHESEDSLNNSPVKKKKSKKQEQLL